LFLFADSFAIDCFVGPPKNSVSRPPLLEEGLIQVDPASAASEASEANEGQDGDNAEVSREDSSSTLSPPPANSGEPSLDKKRKHLDELLSSSTSTPKNMLGEPSPAKASKLEIFDALDSFVLLSLYIQTFSILDYYSSR
jgi:hypothetical protein